MVRERFDSWRNRGLENEAESSQFKVTAEGADLVYRWLSLKHLATKQEFLNGLPGINGDPDILLADFITDDSTIEKFVTVAAYNKDEIEFSLKTQFKITPENNLENFLGYGARRFADNSDDKIKKIGERLQLLSENSKEENQLKVKFEEDNVSLHYKGSEFGIHAPAAALSVPIPLAAAIGINLDTICFHLDKDMESETKDDFEKDYQTYAEALEVFIEAVYGTEYETAPDKTLEIKPPKNLETRLNAAEDAAKNRKRMVGATGMFDSDEEIKKEIEEKIELIEKPTETFDDIGGNEEAKEQLLTIVHALKEPQAYLKWGTKSAQGVLLYGEPGTGKTMLTKALAHEAGVGIYVVELADVLHSLYGKTERLLSAVFEKARENAPIILLIDELDSLAGNRNQSTEVTSRVVTVLNTNLDGLYKRPQGVVVVGTTNRVDAIDPAIKRPGRLDLLIPVSAPTEKDREKIFELKMKKAQEIATESGGGSIFSVSDLTKVVDVTKDFTGADIEEVVRRTLAFKVREEAKGQQPTPVTTEDLLSVVKTYEKVRKDKVMGFTPPSAR